MMEMFLEAFAILFVTIGPIDSAVVFHNLTQTAPLKLRHRIALRANLIAGVVLLGFALFGDDLLRVLGIRLSSLEMAGGILLLLVAIDMVLSVPKEGPTVPEPDRLLDVAVFPLATPLLASPAAILASVTYISRAGGDWTRQGLVMGVIVLVLCICYACFLGAGMLLKVFGRQGNQALTKVLGVLLTGLAVELIVDGISQSQLFK